LGAKIGILTSVPGVFSLVNVVRDGRLTAAHPKGRLKVGLPSTIDSLVVTLVSPVRVRCPPKPEAAEKESSVALSAMDCVEREVLISE